MLFKVLFSFFLTFYFVLGCINAVIVSDKQQRGLKKCCFLSGLLSTELRVSLRIFFFFYYCQHF